MKKRYCYLILLFTIHCCILPKPGKALSGDTRAHDPSAIIKDGNTYWMFSTGEGIRATWSSDLYSWKSGIKTVFPRGVWPPWINQYVPNFAGDFWAPDIVFANGRYYLYYSCSEMASPVSAIGVASSPTLDQNSPEYKWTDLGMVVSSSSFRDINAIDPSLFLDTNGKLYLTYGSYYDGLGVIELDPTTGKVRPGAELHHVAGGNHSSWEAGCLIREGSYYYLFANKAFCCTGTSSTYYIVAGRSTSPTGPFVDKNGVNLRDNFTIGTGTPVMVTSGRYIGPGHFGLLKDNGRNFVSMHYYDGANQGTPTLDIANLQFSADGWPVISRNYINPGRYKIINKQSQQAWEVDGCRGSNAQQISVGPENNSPCQEWNLTPDGDGYYKISNDEKNIAMDVPSCNSADGVRLQGWNWLNNDCQKFKIEQTANGQYVFTSFANHNAWQVVQMQAGMTEQGAPLNLFEYRGAQSQQWTVSKISSPDVFDPTDVTDSSFTIKWNARENASYHLDVLTSLSNASYETVAGWNFQSGTNKANAGIAANLNRTITAVGTDLPVYNSKGNGGQTAQATGWTFNGREKYWEINFTTVDYFNIQISSKQRSASLGPRHFMLQYKIGEGGTYADIPGGFVSNLDNYTSGIIDNISLPEECDNQPSVYVRWLMISPTNLKDYATENQGKSNIDDIVVIGNTGNYLTGYSNLLVNDTTKVVTGLTSGTDFFYRIREVRGHYQSPNSNLVRVTTTGTTPVNFTSIDASEKNRYIEVNWKVAPEKNILRYEIERSPNGRSFTEIGSIPTKSVFKNTESYSFLDLNPGFSENFYRVKAVMVSGITKYTSVVKVLREGGNNGVLFYPNPSDGKMITMQFLDEAAGINHIKLLNSIGQEIYKTEINHAGGALRLPLLLNNLTDGIYYFSVRNGNKKSGQAIIVTKR